MKIVYRDRCGDAPMPDALRERVARRLDRVGHHLDLVVEAEIEVDAEARRGARPVYAVALTLRLKGRHLSSMRARQTGRALPEALDAALDTIDTEARKLKDRIKSRP
jgi:ribosomal subunit interface protein